MKFCYFRARYLYDTVYKKYYKVPKDLIINEKNLIDYINSLEETSIGTVNLCGTRWFGRTIKFNIIEDMTKIYYHEKILENEIREILIEELGFSWCACGIFNTNSKVNNLLGNKKQKKKIGVIVALTNDKDAIKRINAILRSYYPTMHKDKIPIYIEIF
jgi:hypothetical protein